MNRFLLLTHILIYFTVVGCQNSDPVEAISCAPGSELLYAFTSEDGREVEIYTDGKAYYSDAGCEFAATIFDPDFFEKHFVRTANGVELIIDNNTTIAPFKTLEKDFESPNDFLELFVRDLTQLDRFLTSFTLQSPSAPTVNDYVALRQCILNQTCDFIDNRITLTPNPTDPENQVLKFSAVPPSPAMVTSKSSISSSLVFFEQGDDFWFEASFYIEEALPTTLADFESSHFLESPGPRLIFKGNEIAIENKFGDKITYRQNTPNVQEFPLNEWVTIKVHLKYGIDDGIIQLWQNDVLIIDEIGRNIPFDIWVQDNLEIGISATDVQSTVYVDNLRFSQEAF